MITVTSGGFARRTAIVLMRQLNTQRMRDFAGMQHWHPREREEQGQDWSPAIQRAIDYASKWIRARTVEGHGGSPHTAGSPVGLLSTGGKVFFSNGKPSNPFANRGEYGIGHCGRNRWQCWLPHATGRFATLDSKHVHLRHFMNSQHPHWGNFQIHPSTLKRVVSIRREPFNCRDLFSISELNGLLAGAHGFSIDVNGTSPAFADSAAEFCAGESERIAQDPEQLCLGIRLNFARGSVHNEFVRRHWGAFSRFFGHSPVEETPEPQNQRMVFAYE